MMRCVAVLLFWVLCFHPSTCVDAQENSELLINQLTQELQQFYDNEVYRERIQHFSKRAKLNHLSSKLFGLIRQGHKTEVAKTLERFDVQSLEVPPPATTEMSTQELVKLRIGQWLYTQQLVEKLGDRQLQFLEDLHRIQPIQLKVTVAIKSIEINADQDKIKAEVVVSGKPSSSVRFVLSDGTWLFDGTDSPVYFSLKPEGILKQGDANFSPAIMRDLMQEGKTEVVIALLDEALAAEPENPVWIVLNSNLVGYLARDNLELARQRSLDQYQALLKGDGLNFDASIALAEAVEFLVNSDRNASLEEKLAIIEAGRKKVHLDPDQAYVPLRSFDTSKFRVLMSAGRNEEAKTVMEDLLSSYRQRLSGIDIGPLTAFVGVVKSYTSAMQRAFPELAKLATEEAVQVVKSALNDDEANVGHFGLLFDLQLSVINNSMRKDPATAKILLDQLQREFDALKSRIDPSDARGLSRYEMYISQMRAQVVGS